jgi:hypothetical protein
MTTKRFSNQSIEKIIAHLKRYLDKDLHYNLFIDLFVNYAEIKPCYRGKRYSEKRERFRELVKNKKPKERKKLSARKLRNPKIRSSRKLGRLIKL